MGISDWSSDVCASDLGASLRGAGAHARDERPGCTRGDEPALLRRAGSSLLLPRPPGRTEAVGGSWHVRPDAHARRGLARAGDLPAGGVGQLAAYAGAASGASAGADRLCRSVARLPPLPVPAQPLPPPARPGTPLPPLPPP